MHVRWSQCWPLKLYSSQNEAEINADCGFKLVTYITFLMICLVPALCSHSDFYVHAQWIKEIYTLQCPKVYISPWSELTGLRLALKCNCLYSDNIALYCNSFVRIFLIEILFFIFKKTLLASVTYLDKLKAIMMPV